MKKLFLWTFVLTLLCTWAVVGADQTPNVPTISSQGSDLDREAIRAEKEKAMQEILSGVPLPTNIAPAGSAVPKKAEADVELAEPSFVGESHKIIDTYQETYEAQQVKRELLGNADPVPPVEKPAYDGPGNVPDENVILQGGERCEDATVIPGLPYSDNGTTIGAIDDYDEVCPYTGSLSPDVVYSYTPTADICVDITLCVGQTDYDTKLYVYENICQEPNDGQEPYACNDDNTSGCLPPSGQSYTSEILGLTLIVGNTYYIVVDGYSSGFGNYTLEVSECGAGCVVECPPGSYVETEPICYDEYEDTYNGGCNSVPNVFEDIPWGSICGTSGTYLFQGGNYRDTDWFRVNVPSAGPLSWTVEAEFDVLIFIIDAGSGDCLDYTILGSATAAPCTPVNLTFNVSAGEYWLWVGPSIFSGIPCGAAYAGTAELLGALTGACCIDDICQFTSEEQQCLDAGGTWYVGETCPEFECPTGCLTQMPNLVNGIFSDIHCQLCGTGLQVLAENADFGVPVNITSLTFWGGYYPTNTVLDPDHFTVIFRADDGAGLPGAILGSMNDIAADIKFDTGRDLFGVDEYQFTIYVNPPQPVPALAWVEIYNNTDPSTDDFFWETGDLDPLTGIIGQAWSPTSVDGPWNYDTVTDLSLIIECEAGEPIFGACCDDESGICTDDVDMTQCPAPLRFAANTLCADLEPPCGEQPLCVDYFVTAPVSGETGNTCGMGNDCALGASSEEVIYEVTIPNSGSWTFSLCGSGYDTYLFVGTSCCGAEIGANDDFCGLQSQLTAAISAGIYYVAIEGFSTGCGDYVLNIYEEGDCIVECPAEGIPEGEPTCYDEYVDEQNGGCNSIPSVFQDINLGDIICGESGVFAFEGVPNAYRDTDWFRVVTTEPGDLSWTVEAEFNALIFIMDAGSGDCLDYTILGSLVSPPCVIGNLTFTVPAGTYWLWVGPSTWDPLPCGVPYVGEVTHTGGGCDDFMTVDIFTDGFPGETTWEMVERASGTVVGSGGPLTNPDTQYSWEVCGDPNLCYDFTIYDSYGDGICCLYGDGHYEIYDFTGTLVCSGAEFGYEESCLGIGQCVPPTGACCIDDNCEYTSEEQPCLDDGGTWFAGEDCDAGYICLPPMRSCDDALYQNGDADGGNTTAAACHLDIGLIAEVGDDFVLGADATIDYITYNVGFWNPGGFDPSAFDAVSLAIYNDAGGIPGGNPVDADCSRTGDVVWTHNYAAGQFTWMDNGLGGFQVDVVVAPGVALTGGTTYWLGVMNHQAYGASGQTGWNTTTTAIGSPCLLWSTYFGYYWEDVFDSSYVAFCLYGEGEPDECVYAPGDADCDGTPETLPDVIAMIGMYRGTVPHCYECDCPPNGEFFAPSADPNGNCVSDELPDVVAQIGIYRGTVPAESCDDCPGQLRIAPGGEIPSLKSKVKATRQSAD